MFDNSSTCLNLLGGAFTSLILSILSAVQLIQLNFDMRYECMITIGAIWVLSKILAAIKLYSVKNHPQNGRDCIYFVLNIIQGEWLYFGRSKYDSIKYFTIQIIIITFPINLINMYIISSIEFNLSGYYIAMIFANYLFIAIANIAAISEYEDKLSAYKIFMSFPSVCTNICYWYLFIQGLIYHWGISVAFLLFNLLLCILDIKMFKQEQINDYGMRNIDHNFYKVLQYIFQFNCFYYYSFLRTDERDLKSWKELTSLSVQCLNIVILSVIKLIIYPLIIQTDKVIYIFLCIAIIQLYLLLINIYFKLTKIQKYENEIKWTKGVLSIDDDAISRVNDSLVKSYKLKIIVDETINDDGYQKQQYSSIKKFRQLVRKASYSKELLIQIEIEDLYKSFNIQMIYPCTLLVESNQIIQLYQSFFKSEQSQNLLKVIINNLSPVFELTLSINPKKFNQTLKYLISIQGFDLNSYQITDQNRNQIDQSLVAQQKNFLLKIRSFHYQIAAFYKYTARFQLTNPQVILYDLYIN